MSNDLGFNNRFSDSDAEAIFSALDKVVAKTPLPVPLSWQPDEEPAFEHVIPVEERIEPRVQDFTRVRPLFAVAPDASSADVEVAPEPTSVAQPWSYRASLEAENGLARRINPAVAAIVALSIVVLVQAIFLFRARNAQPGSAGSDSPRGSALACSAGSTTGCRNRRIPRRLLCITQEGK